MELAASVVVPVYNPGPNLDDCLASLLEQTLSAGDYEIILVDDGSSDGTAERLDAFQERHPDLVRVAHIPNSGWPSRPRNVGIGMARGRFVQFVDNDDTLAPDALRHLVEVGDESDADVVAGKLVSDFRGVKHAVFRQTVTRRTLVDFPFEDTLTPHKMFRRAFLEEHGLRFVEGIRNLEDQIFCMHAYAHARSMAIVGDLACYFYQRRRGGGRNAGDRLVVPADYYGDLEKVLDVVDRHVDSRELRARIQRRFYRTELLGRVRERAVLNYPPEYREEICAEVRRVAGERLLPEVHGLLPPLIRVQSALLRGGDIDGLMAYSEHLVVLRLAAQAADVRWEGGSLRLEVTAQLTVGDVPLRLEPDGDGWLLPGWMAPSVVPADRRVTSADIADSDVDLTVVSRLDAATWSADCSLRLRIDPQGALVVSGPVSLDPETVMGGGRMAAGLWDARLRVEFAGLNRSARLRPDGPASPIGAFARAPGSVLAYWTHPTPFLALDVDEWSHPLQDLVLTDADRRLAVGARGRRLTLATPWAKGSGERAAELVLEPDHEGHAPVACPATARFDAAQLAVSAVVPRLRNASRWTAWLAIGELGGPAPIRLPVQVVAGRLGRLASATVVSLGPDPVADGMGKDALAGSGPRGERPDEPDR